MEPEPKNPPQPPHSQDATAVELPPADETDEQRQLRLLKERLKAAEERAEKAEEKRKKAEEKSKKAEEETKKVEEQRDGLQLQLDPSVFQQLLRLAEDELFGKLVIEKDPSLVSQSGTIKVFGKVYPATLRRWEAFPALHAARFHDLETTFQDRKLFGSINQLEYMSRRISPFGLRNENELRSFIRIAIENPTREILQQYYRDIQHPHIYRVTFRDSASGLRKQEPLEESDSAAGEDAESPAKKQRSSRQKEPDPLPDRWGIRIDPERNDTNCFVGECKAAHKLKPATLRRVLGRHPGDNFFTAVLQRKTARAQKRAGSQSPDTQSARDESPNAAWGEVLVAMVLCQAFHYMIHSGIAFGYIASGTALIFLYVSEEDPTSLLYFPVLFPKLAPAKVRPVEQTAVAYLTSFCMVAAEGTGRSAQWVEDAKGILNKWPSSTNEKPEAQKRGKSRLSYVTTPGCDDRPLPHRRHDDTDGGDGGGHKGPGPAPTNEPARGRSPTKRRVSATQSAVSGQGNSSNTKTAVTFRPACPRRPTLPFCTLACLAGLSVGTKLDPRCPNVAHHAAVAVAAPVVVKDVNSPKKPTQLQHGLTTAALCRAIRTQLARNLGDNCECWDQRGYYGATGAMFKLTLTGTGYTFVGKGVQAAHRHKVEHEASLYGRLSALQGSAIPVCLGLVRLARPFPLSSLAQITDMLLLSWAGWTLNEFVEDPLLDAAMEETEDELVRAGLYDEDRRTPNLTWNEEQNRVMRIDLGESSLCETGVISPRGTKRQYDETEDTENSKWAPKKCRQGRVW